MVKIATIYPKSFYTEHIHVDVWRSYMKMLYGISDGIFDGQSDMSRQSDN